MTQGTIFASESDAFYVISFQQSVMQAIVEIEEEWKSEVEYEAR